MEDSSLKLVDPLLKEDTFRGASCAKKSVVLLSCLIGFACTFLLLNAAPAKHSGAVILSDDEGGGGGGEETGGVKNWLSDKGFGFIAPENGGDDLFCHVSSLQDGEGSVEKGDKVLFTRSFNDRKGKYVASDVRLAPDGKGAAMDMISAGGGGGGGGGEGGERKEGLQGVMGRWLSEKGFGFIQPHEGGDDVFCHFRNFADGDDSVKEGDAVIYTAQFNNRKGKYEAVDVKVDPNPPPPTEPPPPTPAPPGEPGKGILMRWNSEKGYGFIMPDGGGDDLFAHARSLKNGEGSVEEGDFVIYVTQFNARKQKHEATEVEKDPNPPVEEEPEAFSGGPGNHVHHHIHHHIHHHNHNNDDV